MTWSAIFFDFDGVILDSVNVKTEAFASMFRKYGEHVEKAVVEYHEANGGLSRFEKFTYFYKHILNQPINQKTLDHLGYKFNQMVINKVLQSPFIPGAEKTLQKIKKQSIPAFIVSGTPDEELKQIVLMRNLKEFFVEIHGSPRKKSAIVNDIAERFEYQLNSTLFIGDSMTDYETASTCGTQFLGVVGEGHTSPFPVKTMLSAVLTIPDTP
ncbi:MAG: HAD family hydrolase [Desulfamplus sp.]|nr:HAD family hydrolase [Desulfamplus sp.]